MKGVVLAGGRGTRLAHLTNNGNKQAYEVAGQPMISYPIGTLKSMGCVDIVVVTNPESLYDIESIVGDGSRFGVNAEYAIQKQPLGMVDAVEQAASKVDGVFPLICGDTYFDPAPEPVDATTLWAHDFELGHNHFVYNRETGAIGQDKTGALGRNAIVLYAFHPEIFEFMRGIPYSERGEREFDAVYRHLFQERGVVPVQYDGFFGDMGTPEGLERVEAHIASKATV